MGTFICGECGASVGLSNIHFHRWQHETQRYENDHEEAHETVGWNESFWSDETTTGETTQGVERKTTRSGDAIRGTSRDESNARSGKCVEAVGECRP